MVDTFTQSPKNLTHCFLTKETCQRDENFSTYMHTQLDVLNEKKADGQQQPIYGGGNCWPLAVACSLNCRPELPELGALVVNETKTILWSVAKFIAGNEF